MKFNIFNNKKDMTEEEQKEYEKKKNIYSLIGYGILFLVIIIYVNMLPQNPGTTGNEQQTPEESVDITEKLNTIEKNYREKITITTNEETYTVDREVENEKQIGQIITGVTEVNYIFDGSNYYILDQTVGVKKVEELNLFKEYDTTFTDFTNIKKLLDMSSETVDLEEETYKIKRYKISLSELLTTYNQINNTLLGTRENKEVIINVNYNETIESIELDLTSLYTALGKNVDNVSYKIEYTNIGEIDLSSLEEITNLAS